MDALTAEARSARQPEIKTGYGEVESKVHFILPHTPDGDGITKPLVIGLVISEAKQMLVFDQNLT